MDEQHQDILNGIVILFLIINTLAISTLVSERAQDGSLNPGTSAAGPVVVATTTTAISAVTPTSTITAPAMTKTPTPMIAPTPIPARKNFVNVFYIQNKDLDTSIPPIIFNLINPPLIVDFSVQAQNTTDLIPHDYKSLSTEHHDLVNITRPYEDAVFRVKITNQNGTVVTENGYGREFGLMSPQTIKIMEVGNYTISISGMYVNATVSIEVPKDRNFPK